MASSSSLHCLLLYSLNSLLVALVIASVARKLDILSPRSRIDIEVCVASRIHCVVVEEIDIDWEHVGQGIAHHRDSYGDMSASRCDHCIDMPVQFPPPAASKRNIPALVIGGKTIPPEIPATRKEPPLLVWRPSPNNTSVNMVAKQQLSKQKTKISRAILVVPEVVIAATENMKHNV